MASNRARHKLAVIGGFSRPAGRIAHGTHHAAYQTCAAIAATGGYQAVDVFYEDGRPKAGSKLDLPLQPPARCLDLARLPNLGGHYEAIYVANGEQIGPVPFVLRPHADWTPVILSIGTVHSALQWQSLLVALASGSVRSSDGFIFKSQAAQRLFREIWTDWAVRLGIGPSPIEGTVIPNGVDTDALQASPRLRGETRQALRLAPEDVVFLAFSRLSPGTKGDQQALVLRWRDVVARVPNALLLLSGAEVDARFSLELRQLARAAGVGERVVVLQNPFEILADARNALMSAADVFVHLTTGVEETSPLVVHEAMAHGLPVIATDWGGLRETVVPGVNGFLVATAAAPMAPEANALVFGVTDLPVVLAASRAVACAFDQLVPAVVALAAPEQRRAIGERARKSSEATNLSNMARAYVATFDACAAKARDAGAVDGFRPLVDLNRVLAAQASGPLDGRVRLGRVGNAAALLTGWRAEPGATISRAIAALQRHPSLDVSVLAAAIEELAPEAPQAERAQALHRQSAALVRLLNFGVIERVPVEPS